MKLYVQNNETGLVVATIEGSSNEACERKALETYDSDDYSWGYSDYANEPQADNLEEMQADDGVSPRYPWGAAEQKALTGKIVDYFLSTEDWDADPSGREVTIQLGADYSRTVCITAEDVRLARAEVAKLRASYKL